MGLYVSWICILTLSLLCGLSLEQGVRQDVLSQTFQNLLASPLVGQRQNLPAQQVIVPGGFQQHHTQFQGHFPLRNDRLTRLAAGPSAATSIQNQQQHFTYQQSPLLQRDPIFFSTLTKQTPSVFPATAANPRTRQANPLLNPNQPDIQYEYYDGETGDSGDVLYQYGTELNDPAQRPSSLTNLQQPVQQQVLPSQKPAAVDVKSINTVRTSKSNLSQTAPSLISKFVRQNNNRLTVTPRPTPTPSSYVPLIDENEDPDTPVSFNGRSVQSHTRGGNNIPLRSSHFVTHAPLNRLPPGYINRTRTVAPVNTTRRPTQSSASSNATKRPAVLRNANGRFSPTSRPPFGRSRSSTTSKEDVIITASSTYKPEGSQRVSLTGTGGRLGPGKAKPEDDYTIEYVNAEDYSGSQQQPEEHQYYEVSQEQVARPPLSKTPSRSKSTETKVTVSVSSKSSTTTSTTTTTTSTTTAPPPSVESSSDESAPAPDSDVVFSVATTKSVSSGLLGGVTPQPTQVTTASPRVTFSRATGSSIVVASVQTSRSVAAGTSKSMSVASDNLTSGAETAPEYYEEEYSYADTYPVLNSDGNNNPHNNNNNHHNENPNTNAGHQNGNERRRTSPSLISPSPTESIMDKLDRVQSELANGVLNGLRGNSPSPVSPSASSPNPIGESPSHNVHIQRQAEQEEIDGDEEEEEEEEETVHNNDEEDHHHPIQQKVIHKNQDIPLGHFETLVETDAGGTGSQKFQPALHQSFSSSSSFSNHPESSDYRLPSTSIRPQHGVSFFESSPTPFFPTSTLRNASPPLQSILSAIRFQDSLPPGFLPPDFTTSTPVTTTTTTTTTSQPPAESTIVNRLLPKIQFEEINISALLPKGYKPLKGSVAESAPTDEPSTTTSKATTATTRATSTTNRPANPLDALLKKVHFKDVSALLPPGYKPTEDSASPSEKPSIESLLPIKFETPVNFLPPGYKLPTSASADNEKPPPTSPSTPTLPPFVPSTTKKAGGLIFPTKPGGFRVGARPSSTVPPSPDTPPPPSVTIATGWPTRKTTEFTGWPTSSTTPMTTTTTTTTTTTERPTTTTTATTTTTPPPKRSATSMCAEGFCKMEAVLRIIGGVRWKPEYADINTEEFKTLENNVKRALDGAYRSSGLAPWYRAVEIEGFSKGSVLVDYFVTLENVDRQLSTQDVRQLFHSSLFNSNPEDDILPVEKDSEGTSSQVPVDGRLKLGKYYSIDPRYTDFKVRNGTDGPGPVPPDQLIPQWGIAVIVIGLASLLFVIIFGVTVLVNKHKNSKKKNTVSLTQEMLSEFNKSHLGSSAGGMDNYGADDLYNMDDVWNDKQMDRTFDRKPTKVNERSTSSGKGSANYNIYDSWKTEWNGYYYNGNYYGDSGYAPSRRRSDYDTNF